MIKQIIWLSLLIFLCVKTFDVVEEEVEEE